MKIPLNEFDACIDEPILKRGLSYFRSGRVGEPVEVGQGEYEAVVFGTDEYAVRLKLENGVVVEHECSCPYDTGPVCKHVAALIFSLRQEELGLKKKAPRKQPAKRRTVAEKVDALLETVSHDELKAFVREQARLQAPFRNLLLASLSMDGSDSAAACNRQLKAILRSCSDRGGFISWSASNRVAEAVEPVLSAAHRQMERGDFRGALVRCTAVMEQMTGALQYSDDSDGSIGGCVDEAYSLMEGMAGSSPSADLRKALLDYCFSAIDNRTYAGWDWHEGMLRLGASLAETDRDVGRIFDLLDLEEHSAYGKERAQCIRHGLIARLQGEEAAEAYADKHLENCELRSDAIQRALGRGEYAAAEEIALGGVAHDRTERPGLVAEWQNWLLRIARARGDDEAVVRYARILFIGNVMPQQDYYEILKKHVAPEAWPDFQEALIDDIAARGGWQTRSLLAGIFIREGWTKRLLELVSESRNFNVLAEYEPSLAGDYSPELVELYAAAVMEHIRTHTGRNHYQEACRYLRRMIKLGGRARTTEVVAALRAAYPGRRALLEELDLV